MGNTLHPSICPTVEIPPKLASIPTWGVENESPELQKSLKLNAHDCLRATRIRGRKGRFQQKAGLTPGRPRVTAASGLHGGPLWPRLQRGELSK